MIKLLVILLILIVILSLIALRYRRQIQTGIGLWRMFRQVRKASKPPVESSMKRNNIEKSEALISCVRCGKWVAPSDAVSLRSNTFYCSTKCMEKAARLESLVDKS